METSPHTRIHPDTTLHTAKPNGSLPHVLDLSHVGAADLPIVGGKAANLGELIGAGFPVPPGFTITTAAYDEVVAANGLGESIASVSSPHDGAQVREAFAKANIPSGIEAAILTAYQRLCAPSVAVRSSATAEDLPDAAFAGQQDSFLGIVDQQGLLNSVRLCWGSLWSDRAISYRQKHGFAHADVKLAVVVQELVPADSAGVMFTANPITGARDEIVIDASSGLGEAIVSGLVTPDHIILRKRLLGWRIVEQRLGRREVEIRPRAGGGTEQVVGSVAAGPVFPDAMPRRLARLGSAIQRHFGRPQDIEWAIADGELFVLQSRPITALPEPEPRPRGLQLPRSGPTEYFQIRPYPLDMTTWTPALGAAITRMLPLGNTMPSFDRLWVAEDGVVSSFAGWPSLQLSLDLLLTPVRMVPLAWRHDPAKWREDPILGRALLRLRDLEARNSQSLSWDELLATAQEAMTIPFDIIELRRQYFPRTVFALGGLRLTLGLLGHENLFGALLSGVDNKTLEANRELEVLATAIRSDHALATIFAEHDAASLLAVLAQNAAGRRFLDRLNAFLDSYGHRETGSPLLISQPTWRDAPESVLGILKGMALVENTPRVRAPSWETARDEVLAHPALSIAPFRKAFLAILNGARCFPSLREDTHFAMTMPMPALRRTLLEMGRRLADLGVLDRAEDVFHLRFDELQRLAGSWPPAAPVQVELRTTAQQRAQRRAALADTPLIGLASLPPSRPTGDALLAGVPGSPGIAEGPVRIVRDATAFGTLKPGEVLVAPYTNPSWTPLFTRAAAVIVDAGSAMSHAAIVAREYGIPAVMGTGDAMNRLRDGQLVRVDGSNGLVFPIEAAVDALASSP